MLLLWYIKTYPLMVIILILIIILRDKCISNVRRKSLFINSWELKREENIFLISICQESEMPHLQLLYYFQSTKNVPPRAGGGGITPSPGWVSV